MSSANGRWTSSIRNNRRGGTEDRRLLRSQGPCRAHYCETPGRSRPDESRGAGVVPRGGARGTEDRLHLHARLDALPALARDHKRDCQPGPCRRPANRHHVDRSASSGHTLAGRDVVRLRRRGPAHRGSGKRQAFPRSARRRRRRRMSPSTPSNPWASGLRCAGRNSSQSLASETNGAALVNTNDLSGGMKRLASGLSSVLPARLLLHQHDVRRPGAPDQRQGCEARRRGQCKTDVSRTDRQGSRGSP